MLSDRCLSCLSVCPVCPVCDVRALWPNGWTDQDETWHAGRPRTWPHCVRWGPSSPSPKGAQLSIFGPYPLRPNGCIDQDATWYGGRPRPRRLCVRRGPSLPPNFWPMFIIVIVISLEHCTCVGRYWFVQVPVQVLVFYAFYFRKFNRTQSVPLCIVVPQRR